MRSSSAADGMTGPRGGTRAWAGVVLAFCAVQALAAGDDALAGTHWRLVEFQSMDDAQGATRPSEGSLYTMWLHGDGTVAMQLNCNRATGTWSAEPGADGTSGRFAFGPLAATKALCPPPSRDEMSTFIFSRPTSVSFTTSPLIGPC